MLNAIAKFERNLILDNYGKEGFDNLMQMIKDNNSGDSPLEINQDMDSSAEISTNKKSEWCDNLWNSVIDKSRALLAPLSAIQWADHTLTSILRDAKISSMTVATAFVMALPP